MKFVHTADTHLGFEITKITQSDPQGRQRRAASIFQNFGAIVQYALEVEADILSQFWRFSEEMVIRFNLTGGKKASDYPDVDFQKLRGKMPPVLECHFAIKTEKGWILK